MPDEAERFPFAVVSRAGGDAQLCTFTRTGVIQPSRLWVELVAMIGDLKAAVCSLDAAADLYGGNENDRSQVRQFINMLRQAALAHKCAMLLAGHPSVDAMKTGRGYSGSTAWNNSPRARWGLVMPQPPKTAGEDEIEPDQSLRELTLEKTNRGQPGARLRLRWQDGCYALDRGPAALDVAEAKARFLQLLLDFTRQGRPVSHKEKANSYAPTAFAKATTGKRYSRDAYERAMSALFDDGRLEVVWGPEGVRRSHQKEMLRAT